MASNGWVKLHRSIADHWVWDCEFSYAQAWIDLLLSANHTEKKVTLKGQLVTVERGQQARSEVTLSKSWRWSRNKVRRFLKNLENDGMIEQKTTHLTSIITICNYDSFQSGDTTGGTAKGQQTEQLKDSRRNTNKNEKNEKNEKEDSNLIHSEEKKPSLNYEKIKDIFNSTLTNASSVVKLTDNRKKLVKKLFDEFDLDCDKFESYLSYMNKHPQCQWMFEKRLKTDGSGQYWNKKTFDYFVSDKCFLNVKENL